MAKLRTGDTSSISPTTAQEHMVLFFLSKKQLLSSKSINKDYYK